MLAAPMTSTIESSWMNEAFWDRPTSGPMIGATAMSTPARTSPRTDAITKTLATSVPSSFFAWTTAAPAPSWLSITAKPVTTVAAAAVPNSSAVTSRDSTAIAVNCRTA
jgi:hypothetical protein